MNRPTDRRFLVVVLLVLAVGIGLRAWHLEWGLPSVEEEAFPSKVAITMWGFDDGKPHLDPETAGWPALSFYVQRGLQEVQYRVGAATGKYAEPMDYFVAWRLDPTDVVLLGRYTSVLCYLAVVVVALLLGRRFAGTPGALLAGGLCAVSPLLVQHAQLVEPDALVVLFAALCLLWFDRVVRHGRVRDYALTGLWIGLGTAGKYTPALLAPALWLLHMQRRRSEGLSNRYLGLDDRRLGWAALVAFLSFCAASPYTLADLEVLRRDFAYQALHMRTGHFGHEQQGLGYLYYLGQVLPRALGWPALATGLAGLVWSVRRIQPDRRILLWGFLPYFLVLGALSTHFDRYMVPVVLPLALAAAVLVRRVADARPRMAPWIWAGATVLLLTPPAVGSVRYHRLQGAPSTQELARDWVLEHVDPERETIATEFYGPDLVRDERDLLQTDPAFQRMNEAQQSRLLERPFYRILEIPMYSVRTEYTPFYYDLRHYLAYDWLIITGAVSHRYQAHPDEYPVQNAFYDLLEETADPEWSIRPGGRVRGPSISIYRIDDDFRRTVLDRLGPMSVDFYVQWASHLHAPHFFGFLETIAAHAEFRHRWDQAAVYYETIARASDKDEVRASGFERAAGARFQAGELDRAEDLFRELERFPDQRLVALGNLGLIAERRGEIPEARSYYETLVREDPSGEAGTWARSRLAAIDGMR
jgi:tetratricopeptide (TPR) repeat protein